MKAYTEYECTCPPELGYHSYPCQAWNKRRAAEVGLREETGIERYWREQAEAEQAQQECQK